MLLKPDLRDIGKLLFKHSQLATARRVLFRFMGSHFHIPVCSCQEQTRQTFPTGPHLCGPASFLP